MPKPNVSSPTEHSSSKGKYTSFNLNSLLPKQKPHTEASVKGVGNSRMQVLGKSSVLSRAAPKVPLPFNLPSLRKESAVEATSETEYKDGKDSSPQKVETSRQEQPNSYATVAASRMKSHSIRYSPTMSGRAFLDTDEHFRDSQDNNRVLQSSQLDSQRIDLHADSQQKNFPILSHSSKLSARVSISRNDAEEALGVRLAQGNLDELKSEKSPQNEPQDVRSNSRTNERVSYSTENEIFSESEIEREQGSSLKDKRRVILRRQEETKVSTGQEEQSWKTERDGDFAVEYGISYNEGEPLYESDTITYGNREMAGPSLNSGFLSDSNMTSGREVQRNDSIADNEASRVSLPNYLRERPSQASKARYSSSRKGMSGRYKHTSSSKLKGHRRGIFPENLGQRTWRVVSDQRTQMMESKRKEYVASDSFRKEGRFREEKTQVYQDSLPRWSEKSSSFVPKATSQSKEAFSSSNDGNLSEINNIEELFEDVSLQETPVHPQEQEINVDLVSLSTEGTQREYRSNEGNRKAEDEMNVSSFLTFGSLLSDLNALSDSSDWNSPIFDFQSSTDKVLSDDLWGQVNGALRSIQSDSNFGVDRTSSIPISKQKLHQKFSRKRSIQNGRIHRKKVFPTERDISSKSKKSSKVWMAKESTSPFLDKQQTERHEGKTESLSVGEVEQLTFIDAAGKSQSLTSFTTMKHNNKVSPKWRKMDSPFAHPRATRSSRAPKEWVAKHPKNVDQQHLGASTVVSPQSQEEPDKSTSISATPRRKWHSNSVMRKSSGNASGRIKSQEVSNQGNNPIRWRKVTEKRTSDETTNLDRQEVRLFSLNGYRPHSSKTWSRGRSRSVHF
ncbi:hypothetical protein Gasu2_65320 [Galdieria sulphuraria]|nr:hypothetical protein Gasu2_65320 [Galdieria sulphuraria]